MTVRVVTAPEPRTKAGILGSPPVEGLFAEVEGGGYTLQVSQLPGETQWTVDAVFPPGSSCPTFCNGFGARYLRTRVASPDVVAAIEAARAVTV